MQAVDHYLDFKYKQYLSFSKVKQSLSLKIADRSFLGYVIDVAQAQI